MCTREWAGWSVSCLVTKRVISAASRPRFQVDPGETVGAYALREAKLELTSPVQTCRWCWTGNKPLLSLGYHFGFQRTLEFEKSSVTGSSISSQDIKDPPKICSILYLLGEVCSKAGRPGQGDLLALLDLSAGPKTSQSQVFLRLSVCAAPGSSPTLRSPLVFALAAGESVHFLWSSQQTGDR